MRYAAAEYTKMDHMWRELEKTITQREMQIFARRNEDMQNMVAHVGDGRAMEMFKNGLRLKAMRDPRGFEDVAHVVHEIHNVAHTYRGQRYDGKASALAKEIGIARENYDDVIDLSSKEGYEATKNDLEDRYRHNAGFFRKAMDTISDFAGTPYPGSSRRRAIRTVERALRARTGITGSTGRMLDRLEGSISHANEHLSDIAGNAEQVQQFVDETLINERVPLASERGPSTYREAITTAEAVKEADIEAAIKERIASDPMWESGGAEYQDDVLSSMKREAKRTHKAGSGFWAWFFSAIFGTKFDRAASKAAGRTVHVK
jgi:hypothetical protein